MKTKIVMCAMPVVAAILLALPRAEGYVEAAMSFGAIVAQSSNIVLMRVEAVDKQKNIIIYRKVQDIKGKHPQEMIKHNIGRGGLRANEWKPQMDWAEPGKMAVFFHNGGASETCIGNWWYQAYGGGEWWNHSHAEPFLLRSYCGPPEKLVGIVSAMLAGQETVVPCMVDGNKEDLHNRRAKIQRLKVSLKLQDYNPKRDFVGWGGEDFRRIQGMSGFTHISPLTRIDEPQAISIVDFNGDGKQDVCLVGGGKIALLQNAGDVLSESSLPMSTGARAAVWADYNGDGKPDLLVASVAGLRLFTNQGDKFVDGSNLLPPEPFYHCTAAAWLDYDQDGKPDILLANGYHGLRLYRNTSSDKGPSFTNVSTPVGFGPEGLGAGLKGDALTIADVNNDGIPDILYGAASGMLFVGGKSDKHVAYALADKSGIAFMPGRIGPVFGDFDNDGLVDLFVPQKGAPKLFKNLGQGQFADVTAKAGELNQNLGHAAGAAWGDVDNDGLLDLVVGCLKAPNRYFKNKGDGTFVDATTRIGFDQAVYNTQAVALVDLNNDGMLDVVFNNDGQVALVLLGNPTFAGKNAPVTYQLAAKSGVIGSKVWVTDAKGATLATQQIHGGEARGGQAALVARFALQPGQYQLHVRFSTGQTRSRPLTVASDPLRGQLDDAGGQ